LQSKNLYSKRYFSNDESNFHDDFKAIRKKYEQEGKGDVLEEIKKTVESHPLVLFMKGVPKAPQCGFSNLVVKILAEEGVSDYHSVNVLADDRIREGIKKFTNWPTIPQLFINKVFIGGADITKSLFESGELTELLKKGGIKLNPPPSIILMMKFLLLDIFETLSKQILHQ